MIEKCNVCKWNEENTLLMKNEEYNSSIIVNVGICNNTSRSDIRSTKDGICSDYHPKEDN